jgi:RNA polymerase sigma factor (sigma-70 family)
MLLASRLPDSKLIAACLAGDADAWDALIHRYEPLVFTVAVRLGLSHADADDVFQNVCIILLDRLGSVRNAERLSAWLVTTTRREVWRLHRERGASLMSELDGGEHELDAAPPVAHAETPSPEAAALAVEEQRLVLQGLSLLPERCRALLALLYRDEGAATYAEVARELRMPLGTIGASRARCLARLRKILREFGF